MTAAYIPGSGRVPSATVRRAAAFIDDRAGQPVTMPEVAAVAGVTARALQYAFHCRYDTRGWASPANFAAAYRKHFGVSPSHTLRT